MKFTRFTKTLIALATFTIFSANAANVQTLDSTAAIVNNDIILTSELDKATKDIAQSFKKRGNNIDVVSARKAALENLITKSLILQIANQAGFQLTDSQIDTLLDQQAIRANTTRENVLKSFANGQSTAKAREEFREQFILNEVTKSRVRSRIKISDTEVDLLAKNLRDIGSVEPRYHLSQIIVPLSANANANQVQQATATVNSIRAQINNGANFNELAARYTQGALAAQGGDLGYLPESMVPAPFIPSLLKAKKGQVIGPFRSPFGIHLLKVLDISHDNVAPIKTYNANHILLTTSIIFSKEAAFNQLMALRNQILSGKITFEEAARKYSEDPGSASNGGSLGYATPERYDPAFARAMVALRPGQVSYPIESSFGYHLIKLNDIKIDRDSDNAYKEKARDLIYRRIYQEEAMLWEQELREQAYIKVLDPQLKGANINIDQDKK